MYDVFCTTEDYLKPIVYCNAGFYVAVWLYGTLLFRVSMVMNCVLSSKRFRSSKFGVEVQPSRSKSLAQHLVLLSLHFRLILFKCGAVSSNVRKLGSGLV